MVMGQNDLNTEGTRSTSSRFESLGMVDLDFPEYDWPPAQPMDLVQLAERRRRARRPRT